MTSGPVQKSVKEIGTAHPEVEFALVLARTIDSVSSDPQQLRSAVYELARQKLRELAHDDATEKERLLQALEVAIEGVEAHTRNSPLIEKFPVPSARALPSFAEVVSTPQLSDERAPRTPERVLASAFDHLDEPAPRRKRSKRSFPVVLRYLAMLAFFAAIAALVVLQQRGVPLASLRTAIVRVLPSAQPEAQKPVEAARQAPPIVPVPEPKQSSLPKAYGVYAESGGKLFELRTLPMRAPDPRVAISAAITKPSETALPDGHLRFIVFRREGDNTASDPIDVRVMARVTQVTTFDAAGKPVVSPGDEKTWVIRNISIPFHAAPLKEDPQMFEVQPRDADVPLAPGRYVLILKAQAYDFTIEGTVTDRRQCLQRLAAANGVFYSECEKP